MKVRIVAAAVMLAASLFGGARTEANREKLLSEDRNMAIRPHDGVTLYNYTLEEPRKMAVYVARIDLTMPGISFTGTERDPKWGEPIPGANGSDKRKTIGTKRETTVEFMKRRRAEGKNVEVSVNTTGFGPWERPFNHAQPVIEAGVFVVVRTLPRTEAGRVHGEFDVLPLGTAAPHEFDGRLALRPYRLSLVGTIRAWDWFAPLWIALGAGEGDAWHRQVDACDIGGHLARLFKSIVVERHAVMRPDGHVPVFRQELLPDRLGALASEERSCKHCRRCDYSNLQALMPP